MTDGVTANYNDNIFCYTLLNDAGKREARSLHGYNRSDYSASLDTEATRQAIPRLVLNTT